MYENAARNDLAADYDDAPAVRGVNQMLERLEMECDRFGKFAAVLEERLNPVLNPEMPYPASAEAQDRAEPSSPLAGQLERRIEALQQTGARFDRLIKRIDV